MINSIIERQIILSEQQKQVKSEYDIHLKIDGYDINIYDTEMKIDFNIYSHEKWAEFSNKEIIKLLGKKGLVFWYRWKGSLIKFCKAVKK